MNHLSESKRRAPIVTSMALTAALMLAGCAAPAEDPPPPTTPATTTTEAVPSPDGVLPVDPGATSRDVETIANLPPPSAARTSPIAVVELVGMTDRAVRNLLGKPALLRREGPGQVWQYVDRDCVLDLFLYREGDVFQVAHFETRGRDAEQPAKDGCFANLINAASGKSG